jgi:hypothetical protein
VQLYFRKIDIKIYMCESFKNKEIIDLKFEGFMMYL